jgi:hypothetical protein
MPGGAEGGLGSALVGERIVIGQIQLQVTKLLGEGTSSRGKGFAFAFLSTGCHVRYLINLHRRFLVFDFERWFLLCLSCERTR